MTKNADCSMQFRDSITYDNKFVHILLSLLKSGTMVATGFAPWRVLPHRVCPHINSTSDQVLKNLSFSYREEKTTCARWNRTTQNMFISSSLFWKVTAGELKIESLGWVHWGKLGGAELTLGRNWYHSTLRSELNCNKFELQMNRRVVQSLWEIL